jgi:DNA repair exonuclease SbcCD ATPase subunit
MATKKKLSKKAARMSAADAETRINTAEKRLAKVVQPWNEIVAAAEEDKFRIEKIKDYEDAVHTLKGLKEVLETIKADKEDIYRPLKTAIDRLQAKYKAIMKGPEAADKNIRVQVNKWVAKRYDLALERNRKKAAKARAEGKEELAQDIEATTEVADYVPEVPGISLAHTSDYKIIDKTKLPLEYLVPDRKAITALVKSAGPDAEELLNHAVRVTRKSTVYVRQVAHEDED